MTNFNESVWVTTAVKKEQFPESDAIEIVLSGRSNVGKSSCINAICEKKAMAYVGKRPGKTRYLNFFKVNDQLWLVDVPGYGFAQRSQTELKSYGILMEDYFNTRKQCKSCLLVIDSRHGLTADDQDMLDYILEKNYPYRIVATKCDKLTYSKKLAIKKELEGLYGADCVILFSALSKEGRVDLQKWCASQIDETR